MPPTQLGYVLPPNLCGPNHVGDDWRRRRCGDAAATCTRNASCNRGVHDHGNARTSYPPSLIADTISGTLGMEGNVLRASSFTLPLKPFSSIQGVDRHRLARSTCSLNIWAFNRRRVRHDFGTGPIGRNPFLPSSVLLYATTRYSGPSSFASFGRCIQIGRAISQRSAFFVETAGIIMRHEGERQRGERFKVLLCQSQHGSPVLPVRTLFPSFVCRDRQMSCEGGREGSIFLNGWMGHAMGEGDFATRNKPKSPPSSAHATINYHAANGRHCAARCQRSITAVLVEQVSPLAVK